MLFQIPYFFMNVTIKHINKTIIVTHQLPLAACSKILTKWRGTIQTRTKIGFMIFFLNILNHS